MSSSVVPAGILGDVIGKKLYLNQNADDVPTQQVAIMNNPFGHSAYMQIVRQCLRSLTVKWRGRETAGDKGPGARTFLG